MNNSMSKVRFEKLLDEYYCKCPKSKQHPWTTKQIENVIETLETLKLATNEVKSRHKYYYYSRKFEVVQKNNKKLLIKKVKYRDVKMHMLPKEDFYTMLNAVHLATLHGKLQKMYEVIRYKFYIPKPAIDMFIKSCTYCSKKKQKLSLKKLNASISINETNLRNTTMTSKKEYNQLLMVYYKNNLNNCIWTRENLQLLMNNMNNETGDHVEEIKKILKVIKGADSNDHIVWKRPNNIFLKLIPMEEYFDILHEIHLISYHGNYESMKEFFCGIFHIPSIAIHLYLKCCDKCKNSIPDINFYFDRNTISYTANVNLIRISNGFNNNETNWILVYHYTEADFVQIIPVFSNNSAAVAINIFQLFTEFGIPKVLQVIDGNISLDVIIQSLKDLLFNCKLNIETYICDTETREENNNLYTKIEGELAIWKLENPNSPLLMGCYFIQHKLNNIQMFNESAETTESGRAISYFNNINNSVIPNLALLQIKSENMSSESYTPPVQT